MIYLLKVWSITILGSPILFWAVIGIIKNEPYSSLYLVLPILYTTIFMGFILSIPTTIVFWILHNWLTEKYLESCRRKVCLGVLSTIGILLTAFLVDSSIFSTFRSSLLPISYILMLNVAVWIFQSPRGQKGFGILEVRRSRG